MVTIEHLWKADPNLEVVICSAYSDYSWSEIDQKLGFTDPLRMIKKPFDTDSIRQVKLEVAEQIEGLEMIRQNGEQLLELINEFLDLTKIEGGRLQLDAVTFSPRTPPTLSVRPTVVSGAPGWACRFPNNSANCLAATSA